MFMNLIRKKDEELLKWAWPEDVWFHVDKESSAHVYLRLKTGETLDDIPSTVLDDCAQLVKANSIKGNKISNLNIVYTFWTNLKKTADMQVGQVGFHDYKQVRTIMVQKRMNEILNRLNKTKVVKNNVDLRQEREERDRKERNKEKDIQREIRLREKEETKRREEAAKLRSYDYVMKTENMSTNEDGYDSDDFM
ncbi:coiled-coil domain-containing protein [Euroglyphus maynei]|uniref:Coiled-coil domain-containing protein 25 n=1 Tax=Euroglyphus maynei TaxID=6958 RepID=A0A1Y3BVI8_EURMA|nr:coiled-coil domain-containing protein [Euroglyphus maynei]